MLKKTENVPPSKRPKNAEKAKQYCETKNSWAPRIIDRPYLAKVNSHFHYIIGMVARCQTEVIIV